MRPNAASVGGHHRLDLVGIRHVTAQAEAAHCRVRADISVRRLDAALLVAPAEHDARAELGQGVGHLPADAGGAAGDDRGLAGEVEQVRAPSPGAPRSRRTCFCTLPVAVLGSASTNSTTFGTLCRARRVRAELAEVVGGERRAVAHAPHRPSAPRPRHRRARRPRPPRRHRGARPGACSTSMLEMFSPPEMIMSFSAVADLDVAVGMHHPEVARAKPAAGEGGRGRRLVAVVADRDVVSAHDDLAHRLAVGGHVGELVVDHSQRLAHDRRDPLA